MRASEVAITFAVTLFAVAVAADPPDETATLGKGDTLTRLTLEDQYGRPGVVDESVHLILFSRDMDGGDLIKQALADDGGELLEKSGAVYLADISGMPGLVSRLFALPAMRRRGYPMLLDRDGEATRRLPDTEGQATLIFLEALGITRVMTARSVEEVRDGLQPRPAKAE